MRTCLAIYRLNDSSFLLIKSGIQAPNDLCWPSASTWNKLNATVSGKLIKNIPPAASCYKGQYQDAAACALVSQQWTNSSFQSSNPIGYAYPLNPACPPVIEGQAPRTCSLGDSPVYTINATTPKDVAKGIVFAEKHNLRLVVRNTGHDLLG